MKTFTFECGCSFPQLEDDPPEGVLPLLDFDIEKVRFDCPALWALVGRGETVGLFQLDKPLGQEWSRRLKPENIEQLSALTSLLRPGCLNSRDEKGVSMTEHYCRRKNGEESAELPHPSLGPILGRTFSVLVFQEQFMRMASDLAGFDLVTVDKLRKGIGKKDVKVIASLREDFIGGCERVGVLPREKALLVWSWIEAAGSYAFNLAHAFTYSMITVWNAWEKAHSPLGFFASRLRCVHLRNGDVAENVRILAEDAARYGVKVRAPSLLSLKEYFWTDRREIEFGLADVKGIGEKTVGGVKLAVRSAESCLGKPLREFSWFEAFQVLTRCQAQVAKALIRSGAADHWGVPRARMLAEHDAWLTLTAAEQEWAETACEASRDDPSPSAIETNIARCDERAKVLRKNKNRTESESEELADLNATLKLERARLSIIRQVPPFDSVEGMLDALANHYCDERRAGVVRGLSQLLKEPPTPLTDTARSLVLYEQELLGVAVTRHRLDQADLSEATCTVAEFLAGKPGQILLGVEVSLVKPTTTKKGKNPGAKMCQLWLKDRTGTAKAVCFPEDYQRCGHLLAKDAILLVHAERGRKDGDLMVRNAWRPAKATGPGRGR